MKICAISDLHGNLSVSVEECKLLLICGDILPLSIQTSVGEAQEWIEKKFIPWCNAQPCEKVILVAGNHDFLFEKHRYLMLSCFVGVDKVKYLDCEFFEYKGLVIYGTPLCKPFGRWAFMPQISEQANLYRKHSGIDKIDILVSHDTPYGASDIILEKDCAWYTEDNIGNTALREFVELTQPILHVHGHIHSSNHECEKIGETQVYCCSLLNESYDMAYPPLYFDITNGVVKKL